MALMILTIIGPDRPGLVRGLSEALARAGGNWLESRMARLAGQFAGVAMVDAPEGFTDGLAALEVDGLRISVTRPDAPHAPVTGPRLQVEVVGNDRPGIVHQVTQRLAACGANIEEMTTNVTSGAFSGGSLFRATIIVRGVGDAVAGELEGLGADMMVDVQTLDG
jgi:glycine cleavage system regulatory protein